MVDAVTGPPPMRPCAACSGTGSVRCPACRGAGGEWQSGGGVAGCAACAGAGSVPCEACEGEGAFGCASGREAA